MCWKYCSIYNGITTGHTELQPGKISRLIEGTNLRDQGVSLLSVERFRKRGRGREGGMDMMARIEDGIVRELNMELNLY